MRRFVGSVAGVLSILLSSTAFAGPYDAWLYHRPVTVTNTTATALNGYQARLTIDTAALIAANRLQADGSDLRFASADGEVALPYHVEGGMGSASTVVWVRVPAIPASGSADILLLSGRAGQTSAASASATFDLWEPFDGDASSIFGASACGSGTMNIAAGRATLAWSSQAVWASRKGGPNDDGLFPITDVYRIDAEVTAASGSWPGIHWVRDTANGSYSMLLGGNNVRIGESGSNASSYCFGQNWASALQPAPPSAAGTWSLAWIATGNIWGTYPSLGVMTSTSTLFTRNQPLRVLIGGISSGSGSMTFDSIRVRKYAATEPTWSVGAEASRLPGAPTITSADAGALQASISFTNASSTGGPITGYTVDCNGVANTGTTSPIIVSGLTAGTTYSCTVTAQNAAGSGPASAPASVTPYTSPGAPTIDSAVPGNGTITISFSPPANDGGNPITGYTIDCGNGATATGASSPLTLTGLVNGTEYGCTVTAENAAGAGVSSGEVKVTPRTVPGAPTIGAATPGNAQASFAFTPPTSDGGSAITGYTVTCTPAGGIGGTGTSSPLVMTGLANGTTYTCSITASNAAGTSEPSASVTVDPVAPPAPDAGTPSGSDAGTMPGDDAGAPGPSGDAGPPATERGDNNIGGGGADPSGCGCTVVGEKGASWTAMALAAFGLVLASARRARKQTREGAR